MVNNSMGPLPHRSCLVMECEENQFYLLLRPQGDVSAVETAPKPLPPDFLSDRPPRWVVSSYTLKSERLQEVLQHFGWPTLTVDALASTVNHRFLEYCTETDSAWQKSWSKELFGPIPYSNGSNGSSRNSSKKWPRGSCCCRIIGVYWMPSRVRITHFCPTPS